MTGARAFDVRGVTAQGVEKPVLNAYRMLGRLGDTRLAVESSDAWPLDRLDEGEAGMPEEVDALATFNGRDCVSVLVWRHADDQYTGDVTAREVAVGIERLPFAGLVRVRHWRIDARRDPRRRLTATNRERWFPNLYPGLS